jgi:hypothetical protein
MAEGFKRRAVDGLAEAHRLINRPKSKTDRIALPESTCRRYAPRAL